MIVIPALLDTQLTNIKNELLPHVDGATNTASFPNPPYIKGSRIANVLRTLTNLIDVTSWLAATGGTATSVADVGAYTGVNSLVGSKVTFQGNVTGALANVSAYVVSNTVDALFFSGGALPATPQAGDNYKIEFTSVDADLETLEYGKGMGEVPSNPYGSGPSLINAIMKLIAQLGGVMPSYLNIQTATPFHIGSPNAGAGSYGSAGGVLVADALTTVRNTIAAYTKPA